VAAQGLPKKGEKSKGKKRFGIGWGTGGTKRKRGESERKKHPKETLLMK